MIFGFRLFIIFSLLVFSLLFKAWLNFGGSLVGGRWVGKGCISLFPGFVLLFLCSCSRFSLALLIIFPFFSPGYHYSHFVYLNRWFGLFHHSSSCLLFYSIPSPPPPSYSYLVITILSSTIGVFYFRIWLP